MNERWVAVLLLVTIFEPAFGQNDAAWRRHIDDGFRALGKKAYGEAEKQFQAARDEGRTLGPLPTAEALIYLGLVYERQNQPGMAQPLYAEAVELRGQALGPEDPQIASALEHEVRVMRGMGIAARADEKAARALAIRTAHVREKWGGPPTPGALRVGGAVTAPRLTQRSDPEYSEEARLFRHEGSVELSFEVRPDGLAHNIRLRRGLGLGLDEKAAEAISRWRFEPGTKDAKPVTVEAIATVHFRLL